MRWRASKALLLVAAMALLSVGAVIVEESFVHTDDGCAVETHCLACRLALGSTVVLASAITAPVGTELAGFVSGEPKAVTQDGAARARQSRAPPLA